MVARKFSDYLSEQGFSPFKAEPRILLRENGGIYEYVAVYVDDLAFDMKEPKVYRGSIVYSACIKVTGPIQFHFGCSHSPSFTKHSHFIG